MNPDERITYNIRLIDDYVHSRNLIALHNKFVIHMTLAELNQNRENIPNMDFHLNMAMGCWMALKTCFGIEVA